MQKVIAALLIENCKQSKCPSVCVGGTVAHPQNGIFGNKSKRTIDSPHSHMNESQTHFTK